MNYDQVGALFVRLTDAIAQAAADVVVNERARAGRVSDEFQAELYAETQVAFRRKLTELFGVTDEDLSLEIDIRLRRADGQTESIAARLSHPHVSGDVDAGAVCLWLCSHNGMPFGLWAHFALQEPTGMVP